MSNQDYVPVECQLVPKALIKDERYCSLSITAKVLYSLMLDRLKYATQNRWGDQKGKTVCDLSQKRNNQGFE